MHENILCSFVAPIPFFTLSITSKTIGMAPIPERICSLIKHKNASSIMSTVDTAIFRCFISAYDTVNVNITLHVQQTAFSRPRVRQRIDDQIFHASLFRQIDSFQVSRRAVRRFQIDGQVFAHDHAGDLLSNVQRTGFVLGIDETDFLPDSRVVQFRVRSANLSVPQQQRTERLSTAGRTCDADFELGLRALRFSDLNCHVHFLQS